MKNTRTVTIKGNQRRSTRTAADFSQSYARALLRRVELRLRKSAKNRSRREYGRAYNLAAGMIGRLA